MNAEIIANKILDDEVEFKIIVGKGESNSPVEIEATAMKQPDSTIKLSIANPDDVDYIQFDDGYVAGVVDTLCCITGRNFTKNLYDIAELLFSSEETCVDEFINLSYHPESGEK